MVLGVTIYLDNSFLNRPFDNPEIGTNKLEGEVLSLVIKLVNQSKMELVSSSIIEYENSLNPIPESSNTDVFITCDYGILKKYKGKLKVITPLEFVNYYEHANK